MEINELKTEYLALGGLDADMNENMDTETIQTLIELQKNLSELEKGTKEHILREQDFGSPEKWIQQLEELKNNPDVSELSRESDEYRKYFNRQIKLENRIRQNFGLEEKSFHVLDKDLNILIALDNGTMGRSCKEFLDTRGEKADQQETKRRIEDIISTNQITEKQEKDRLEFLEDSSDTFAKLKRVPVPYFIQNREIIENPKRKIWERNLGDLKRSLGSKVKALESYAKQNTDFEIDKRQSIFLLHKAVSKFYQDHIVDKIESQGVDMNNG